MSLERIADYPRFGIRFVRDPLRQTGRGLQCSHNTVERLLQRKRGLQPALVLCQIERARFALRVSEMIEDAFNELPGLFRQLILHLMEHLKTLFQQVVEIDVQFKNWGRQSDLAQKPEKIPGVGPVTATALVATIGDVKHFRNGCQLAAWLGLVPRQHSSGGKQICWALASVVTRICERC